LFNVDLNIATVLALDAHIVVYSLKGLFRITLCYMWIFVPCKSQLLNRSDVVLSSLTINMNCSFNLLYL